MTEPRTPRRLPSPGGPPAVVAAHDPEGIATAIAAACTKVSEGGARPSINNTVAAGGGLFGRTTLNRPHYKAILHSAQRQYDTENPADCLKGLQSPVRKYALSRQVMQAELNRYFMPITYIGPIDDDPRVIAENEKLRVENDLLRKQVQYSVDAATRTKGKYRLARDEVARLTWELETLKAEPMPPRARKHLGTQDQAQDDDEEKTSPLG